MALSRRLRIFAEGLVAAAVISLAMPIEAQENTPPMFGPPLQYTSKPGHEFDSLLATNVSWLKAKLKDRKRRRREAQNSYRLEPAATKPQVQAVIDALDKEIKDTQSALTLVTAKSPDEAARKQVVKANVEDWIKALNDRVRNYRKFADEAETKAKEASRQVEAARYRLDADDDKQTADKAEQEAKALQADLTTAGL